MVRALTVLLFFSLSACQTSNLLLEKSVRNELSFDYIYEPLSTYGDWVVKKEFVIINGYKTLNFAKIWDIQNKEICEIYAGANNLPKVINITAMDLEVLKSYMSCHKVISNYGEFNLQKMKKFHQQQISLQ